jgi:hypothetical protein
MIKNLAGIDAFRLRLVPDAVPVCCNDNRPGRRLAAAATPVGRQRLTSHWGRACGRLECYWQIEPADAASAEAPGPVAPEGCGGSGPSMRPEPIGFGRPQRASKLCLVQRGDRDAAALANPSAVAV